MGNRIRDCWSRLAGLCSGSIGHNGVVRDDHNEEASGDDHDSQADHYDGGAYHDFRQAKHHNVFDYSDAALHDLIDRQAEYDYDYHHPGDDHDDSGLDDHEHSSRGGIDFHHSAEFHNINKDRPGAHYDNDSGDWEPRSNR